MHNGTMPRKKPPALLLVKEYEGGCDIASEYTRQPAACQEMQVA